MTFEQKVKSMTAKEIIMAMVEGLRNPTTKIDMMTFGQVKNGVCIGCAATNTICNIGGYTVKDIRNNTYGITRPVLSRTKMTQCHFVGYFEDAIDELRSGDILGYNLAAEEFGFATIEDNDKDLPYLMNSYTPADLLPYEQLANEQ